MRPLRFAPTRALLAWAGGAWLLASVNCLPSGDQVRGVVQSDILAAIAAAIQVAAAAAVQALVNNAQG